MRLTDDHKWVTRNGDANNHIALYIISCQTTTMTGALLSAQPTELTIFSDWLWKAGTLTWNKRPLTHANNYWYLTNDLSKTKMKPTNGLVTDQLTLTNNRWTKNNLIDFTNKKTDQNWPMTDHKLYTNLSAIILAIDGNLILTELATLGSGFLPH